MSKEIAARRVKIKNYIKSIVNKAKIHSYYGYSNLGASFLEEQVAEALYGWSRNIFILSGDAYKKLESDGINFSEDSKDTAILYDVCRKCLGYECENISFYDN